MPTPTTAYPQPTHLKKIGSMKFSEKLQHLSGMLEVKFKGGAFSTWSDVFVRLEGRWMVMYKRERDATRLAAIELGPGVDVTDISDLATSQKFPRRFDVFCKGGLLPATDYIFRTKSRKDRDLWVHSIATNIHILDSVGLDPMFGVMDLDPVVTRMREALTLTPIRIRSQLAVRCATGEEIVAFLVAEELAKDRSHANQIGRRLLSMNVIHHVVWEKDFLDSPDHYTIAELDDETNYTVEHFQKYMDSRRFWKYFDEDTDSGVHSGRRARSTASSGGSNSMSLRASTSTLTSQDTKGMSSGQQAMPPPHQPDKKAKKCSVCGKSFNPLRRRYFCRQCTAVVCSHCSMSRKDTPADDAGNARTCVSCKLSSATHAQDDFYDRIFSAPSSGPTASASDLSSTRASSFSHLSNSGSSHQGDKRVASASSLQSAASIASQRRNSNTPVVRHDSFNASSGQVKCRLCNDEACAPIRDFDEVPYPVTQDHLSPTDKDVYLAALELEDEYERLHSVRILLRAMGSAKLKQTFSQLCSMVGIATSCPVVKIGLLDTDEYVICGQYGLPSTFPNMVGREIAIASHICRNGSPLVCSNMNEDIRFAGNYWRRDVLHATFCAGIPLQLSNGHIVGAVEVLDPRVRHECMDILAQMQTVVKTLLKTFEEILANAPPEEEYHEQPGDSENLEVVEMQPSQVPPQPSGQAVAAPAATKDAPAEGVMSQNEMEIRLMQLLSQTTTTQEQLRNQQGQMFTAISTHSQQISELAKQLERMENTLTSKLEGRDRESA